MAGPREVVGDCRDARVARVDQGAVRLSSPLRYRIFTGDSSHRRLVDGFGLGRVRHAAGAAENHGAEHEVVCLPSLLRQRPLGEARGHRHVARCVIFLTNRYSRPSAPLQGVGGYGGPRGGRWREPYSRRACAVAHSNDFK